MSPLQPAIRKNVRRPAGCEGHLTRRQAAAVLGFESEFKIRELERQGLLRSVRGPMRTAFYPRPDVLAVKARLAQGECAGEDAWTDADLIALLGRPTETGRPRTAFDLVTETRISIERAERVHAFWVKGITTAPGAAQTPHPPSSARLAEAGFAPHPPSEARRPLPALRGEAGSGERRGDDRLARDRLISELRDPDPRVRQQAFERLREIRNVADG